jgi:hypothetical protein
MADKVTRMVELVETQPTLEVRILSGLQAGLLRHALIEPGLSSGTLIASPTHT